MPVRRILTDNGKVCGVELKDGHQERADAVILACGGVSYPQTGSDGDGLRMAGELGHSCTKLAPSLVPLVTQESWCHEIQGLSLKNVTFTLMQGKKQIYQEFGEMMFTHFGVTGPIVLSASTCVQKYLKKGYLEARIDLKPALDEKTLDARLLSDFKEKNNKDLINAMGALLPTKMIVPFIKCTEIDERKKINSLTKEDRHKILTLLKDFRIPLSGFRPIEEAIVTSGGIDTKEISPKTMESKLVPGLYFAGEVIDVDAYTGGFNLQIAFSTGYLAGKNAAEIY
jgi:predicted Rossmann fold flavoprotein